MKDSWKSISLILMGMVGTGLMTWATFVMFIVRDVPTRDEMKAAIQTYSPFVRAESGLNATLAGLSEDHRRFDEAFKQINARLLALEQK